MDNLNTQPSQPIAPQPLPGHTDFAHSHVRFSFLRILVLLVFALAIAVLSSLGTYWYVNNQASNSTMSSNQNITHANMSATPVASTSPTLSPAEGKFSNIVELGVRFKIPSDLNDLVYTMKSTNSANFSTKSIAAKNPLCGSDLSGIGGYNKISKSQAISADLNSPNNQANLLASSKLNPPAAKEFPDFYIVAYASQAPCPGVDPTILNKVSKAIQNGIQSMELIK